MRDHLRKVEWKTAPLLLVFYLLSGPLACSESSGSDPLGIQIEASRLTGNGPLRVDFSARVPASADGSYIYLWDFGDGESASEAETTHVFGDPGIFSVQLTVDDGFGRQGTDTVEIEVVSASDLAVRDVIVTPLRAKATDEIQVTWSVENLGAPVIGDWTQAVILSSDTTFDANDIVIARRIEVGDPGEGVQPQQSPATLPDELETGDWNVGVVADYDGVIGDQDRTNNVFWSTGRLQIRNPTDTGPDLVVCGISIPAFDALPAGVEPTAQLDDQLALDICLGNIGNRPVGSASFSVFLSSDDVLDDADPRVAISQNFALGVGDRNTVSVLVDISDPISAGQWHVFVKADAGNAIDEQSEDNNVRGSSTPISVVDVGQVEGVDLVLRSLDLALDRAYWGQSIPGSIVLTNRGNLSVERFFVIRFLAEPIAGGMTIVLFSLNVDGFAAGDEQTLMFGLPITRRLMEGEYRISAIVDPTNSAEDVNEANNQRSYASPVTLGGEPSVDPAADSVMFSPDTVMVGEELQLMGRLRNLGRDASGVVEYVFFLSEDQLFSPQDTVLVMGSVQNIEGGGVEALDVMAMVPADLDQQIDRWFVGLVADPGGRITADTSEENNTSFALETLGVTGATGGCREDDREPNDSSATANAIDAGTYEGLGVCGNQDWYAVTVEPHQVLDVSTLWNAAEGTLAVDLLTPMGTLLFEGSGIPGSAHAFALPSADERTVLIRIISDGSRFAYDLAVGLRGTEGGPDIRPADLRVSPSLIQQGQVVAVQFKAVNIGTAEASASQAAVYIHDAAQIMGASFLATIEVEAIPARSTQEVSGTVTVPMGLPDGEYFVGVALDGTEIVDELDETDNTGFVRVRLSQNQACMADPFEPNGSPHEVGGAPAFSSPLAAGIHPDLTVCAGDDDWYAVALGIGERLSATIEYAQNEGDIELTLYGPDGQMVIDESTSILGTDSVGLARSEQAGSFLVRVFLKSGQLAMSNTYSINIDVQDAAACQDDAFEPANPDDVPLLPDGLHELRLCGGDTDAYRFAIPAGNTVSWQLTAGEAPLVMTLFNPDGEEVASDDRRIAHQAQQNGNFVLRITAEDDGEYGYQLRTSGVSGVDLAVDSVELSRAEVTPGADLRIRTVVSNRRGDNARNIVLAYVLSTDADLSPGDTVIAQRVIPLIAGAELLELDERLTMPANFIDLPGFLGAMFPLEAFIIAAIDPDRTVPDVRPANNQVAAPITLLNPCVDDDARTNEGPETATVLDPVTSPRAGVICAYTEDWYRLNSDAAGAVEIRLSFTHNQGDLDLIVQSGTTGETLGQSRTEDDQEVVRVVLDEPGALLVRVDGFDEASNAYSLSWILP